MSTATAAPGSRPGSPLPGGAAPARPDPRRLRALAPWLLLAARVALGGVWVVAGALKVGDPAASVRAVRAYQLLPEAVVTAVGHALPFVEVALGLLLLVGLGTRTAAVASGLLLAVFVVGVSAAWARGLSIDCGCFGGGGEVEPGATRYVEELARDAVLLAASAALVVRPRTPWAVDDLLSPTTTGETR